MISEKTVNEIAVKRGLKRLSISNNPSWIDKNHQEGIELQLGIIKPFWVVHGERKYDQPVSEPMTKTIQMIQEVSEPAKEEPKTQEPKNLKDTLIMDNALITNAELPEFLTSKLMEKWQKMSTIERLMMFQKTPTDKIEKVAVGKNAKGITEYANYVTGNYMFKEANACFLFDWYLDNIVITVCPTGVSVTGKLYAWFQEYNKYLSRPATGYQEINKATDTEIAKKGATTDAIKKGLSLFGFNSDVYSGERV